MEATRIRTFDRAPIRIQGRVELITVCCVLKSGGIYDAGWVEKLQRGVARHLGDHRFLCLSDVEVPCERIALTHDWPSWWSKIELFKPGNVTGQTLYLDLDTVVTGSLERVKLVPSDFAMLRNFWADNMVGSGVMWFSGRNVPTHIYEKFARQPRAYIEHHERNEDAPYIGDQAFIWDCLDRDVEAINDYFDGIRSYKLHCQKRLPGSAALVCFHGKPRPSEIDADWMKEHWA